MENRQEPDEEVQDNNQDNPNDGSLLRRLNSSVLRLRSTTKSLQRDPETFRTAFIHSAAILFVLVCGACALLAYRILEPFLRSILWSILAGAFLFPFKNHLTLKTRYFLRQLDTDSHLLFYGLLILLPLRTIDRTIDSIFPFIKKKWKELLIIFIFLLSIEWIQSGVVYHWLITIGYDIFDKLGLFVHVFDSLWITTIVIAYLIAVLTIYDSSPLIRILLNLLAIPIWFILLIYLSQFLPINYRLIVVILAIILTVVGFIVDFRERIEQNIVQSDPSDDNERRKSIFTDLINTYNRMRAYYHVGPEQSSLPVASTSSASSTPYFTFVLWSLVAIKVYQFYWYLGRILIFVIIYKVIKKILIETYIYLMKQESVQYIIQRIIDYLQTRRDVLTPSPLNGLIRFLIKGDKKFNHGLQTSIDYLVSAIMIVTLLITVLFGTILLIIQIQHESIHMIKLTSNLINETIILQPSFQHMLPDKEHMGKLMDTAVNNFYSVGRTWIAKQVNALSPDSSTNTKLEKDVLQLWDHFYEYMSNTSTLLLPDKNRSTIIYSPKNHSLRIPNLDFHLNDLYRLVHNNLDFLRNVLDSVWKNTTLLLTLLSTIISLLFTGGFALLNFLVSFIVFVTLLFYLLSHSDEPIYRPTEWLNNTLSVGGKGLGKAVNDAVTSVFVASLKIAVFYGLYTYVLHTIVGSNLVFLPAVIASVCAVTLKSYWAALPGCLDVWLVQQRPIGALILLLGQIAPTYVVDTTIYSDVKGGGHQYLTALAIAGGVYYRGIEGALIGPIVLCCLLVGVRLYNETMATTLSSNHEQETLTSSLSHPIPPLVRAHSVQQ
ncbi:unnamed protein product [Rotaria sp. Silwood1]|nr:unnamed protein product [Rotaria sp. Silwood1]CAF3544225.1 unnamed protein product [Rotaria sp. Silwood1]CAF4697113.1 unnamed protein product [Rotaria sp. Silwood1]CAF4728529.1 unnamed protein product [Rotaria sp. Silwood1]